MNEQTHSFPAWSFHLYLFSEQELLADLWLPDKTEGFYRFSPCPVSHLFSIDAEGGHWVIHCISPAFFENVGINQGQDYALSGTVLLRLTLEDRRLYLFAEKIDAGSTHYSRHVLKYETDIRIGRSADCDICCPCDYLSVHHACISRRGSHWEILPEDPGSLVYVNGKRTHQQSLRLGDHIFLSGLHILIGTNFISVNEPEGKVRISSRICKALDDSPGKYQAYSGYSMPDPGTDGLDDGSLFFNRAPRKLLPESEHIVTLEGPPMSMQEAGMPLILRMGNSMVMGGRAAFTGNYTGVLTSLLFPLLSSRYTEAQRREYEDRRFLRYTEYLEEKKKQIRDCCTAEASRLNSLFPDFSTVLRQSRERVRLWERRPEDEDFLVVRLGCGDSESKLQLDYPAEHFDLERDDLLDRMYRITEEKNILRNVPICLSLREHPVVGAVGPRSCVLDLMRQLIVQIAVRHSYDEVKIVLLADDDEMEQFRFVRFLPHCWNDACDVRLLAADEPDACTLGEYLKNMFPDTQELRHSDIGSDYPYYVVFALNQKIFGSVEFFKSIMKTELLSHFSFFTAFDDPPKECTDILQIQEDGKNILNALHSGTETDPWFRMDPYRREEMAQVVRMISNLKIKAATRKQSLPKMLTFMEMLQAGKLEHLNPLKRWKESDPIRSLAAPVGVHSDGTLFCLDLHEKHQGPHGLIAGMTGSGKSEFIITYILSMAVNYHPDEVAFILIDYKGGGLADAFNNPRTGVRLPHLVGTITNLDGSGIERSLMSIQSELIRRQNIFHQVQNSISSGTIDIYGYQKLYREGKVGEPMPHLFIISDEFAELKQQKPEFMEKLVSASRIGRSLGIHLILATQKPSGVVNDQIRSNTKFRVCLRVQDRTDSMDMLRRPEAAELRDTGRFYLQVGYNEYFALGQSAWCGAEYAQQEEPPVSRDDSIEFLDTAGRVVSKIAPAPTVRKTGVKQVAAVVKYLSDIADKIGYQTKPLWAPPLPKDLDLEQLPREEDPLKIPIGLLDDPARQAQFPLVLDLHKCQHILIAGEARSGKTTLVRSILYSLVRKNSPADLNFYILDYSSRTLGDFSRLPHCGSVLREEDGAALPQFFQIIAQLRRSRKQLFSELEVDSYEAANARKPLPVIFVVIDNLAGLSDACGNKEFLFNLHAYIKDSSNYGIHYILTCNHMNEMPSRILQEMDTAVCLSMRDRFDCSTALGCRITYLPPEGFGRGLYCWNGLPLELQTASFMADASDEARRSEFQKALKRIADACAAEDSAQQMPVSSFTATYPEFCGQFSRGRIPLGITTDAKKPIALPLRQFSSLRIYQGNPAGTAPLLENLLYAAHREQMDLWIVRRRDNSCFDPGSVFPYTEGARFFSSVEQELEDLTNLLFAEFMARRDILEGHPGCNPDDLKSVFPILQQEIRPGLILIESYSDFCSALGFLGSLRFQQICAAALSRNFHIIAMYGPGDTDDLVNKNIYTTFNGSGDTLVFSDRPNRQIFANIPVSLAQDGKPRPFNYFTMLYHAVCHQLVMPVGDIQNEEPDPDDSDIFGS